MSGQVGEGVRIGKEILNDREREGDKHKHMY